MNISTLPLLLAITLGATATAATAATATATGSLSFAGQLNAGTCNLASGDVSRTITLPTIKISDLDESKWAGGQDFELTAECESDISNVTFIFAGTPSTGNAALFANTGTSGGVALWLVHKQTTNGTIPANGTPAERSRTVATINKKAVIPLMGAYYKTGAALSQGTLVSGVTVSITYN